MPFFDSLVPGENNLTDLGTPQYSAATYPNNQHERGKYGYDNTDYMLFELVKDLLATPVLGGDPAFIKINAANLELATNAYLLEAKGADNLWATDGVPPAGGWSTNQNWRIVLTTVDVSGDITTSGRGVNGVGQAGDLIMFWGTSGQLADSGGSVTVSEGLPYYILCKADNVGRDEENLKYPWRYNVVTTDRGIAIATWAMGFENVFTGFGQTDYVWSFGRNNANNDRVNDIFRTQNAICIQRPTNTVDGTPKVAATDNKAPVFVIALSEDTTPYDPDSLTSADEDKIPNGSPDDYNWAEYRFKKSLPIFKFGTVRDSETPFPDVNLIAMDSSNDRIVYPYRYDWHGPSMLDNYNHAIKFAFGLATKKHIYLEEIDMFGLVSAGSFAAGQTSSIALYTPTQNRIYSGGPGAVQAVPTNIHIGSEVSVYESDYYRVSEATARIVLLRDHTGGSGIVDYLWGAGGKARPV